MMEIENQPTEVLEIPVKPKKKLGRPRKKPKIERGPPYICRHPGCGRQAKNAKSRNAHEKTHLPEDQMPDYIRKKYLAKLQRQAQALEDSSDPNDEMTGQSEQTWEELAKMELDKEAKKIMQN